MKLRMMLVSLVALMGVACGGTMEEEAVAVDETANVEQSIGGGQCGTKTCAKGTFCCNSSCGVCAPVGGGCLDVMCPN